MKSIDPFLILLLLGSLAIAQSPDILLGRIMGNRKFIDARQYIEAHYKGTPIEGAAATQMKSAGLEGVKSDRWGNVSAIRKGSQDDEFVAIISNVHAPEAQPAMMTLVKALDSVGIATKSGLLFIAMSPEADNAGEAVSEFLEQNPYRQHVRACVVVDSSGEETVFGPPNSIGSTIVQYGLQSVTAYGMEPNYEPAQGILTIPIKLRIPCVGLGLGADKASAKGIELVMTTVLAIAGVQ